ncbi:MAG TPA: phage portal protein [Pelagibacterium sp.]|uniref:phage portal protein n=1 Tax=uncultured Pelagibacterium sp. TaxID=1159875 RepID=UPI000ED86D39|nr:phage portal protein [Pelagibacterium sp.]|tara:strand:+ start:10235 stop:11431 length:1197 start_codon:yes stop_codon:yes gene_type:complete
MRIGPLKIEWKSLSSPTEAEYEIFTGTSAGGLDPLTLPAVQSAIRLLSEATASLDLKIERKVGAGWSDAPDHPVAKLLSDQPNDWSSTFDLIRDLVATALTVDKGGLAFVNRVGNEVREVVRYEPAHYTIDFSQDGRQEPTYRINNTMIPASDIIHVRGPFSRCPLNLARDAINAAKHMERHAGNLFKNAARPGGALETPKNIGDEGVKKMIAGWKAAMAGSENAGNTPVLWDGTKFVPFTLNSTDSQFLENRKFQIEEIARAFNIPAQMIGMLDRATWSNMEHKGREFLSYSLEPWLRILEAALRRALFTAEERGEYRITFDRDDLTRADLTARATAINSLIASRVLNPNEARGWIDLAPYEGGNTFANPNTGSSQPNGNTNAEEETDTGGETDADE